MCGISGFCSFNLDYEKDKNKWTNVLINMRKSLNHRGNDDSGKYLTKNCGFSHARLSIRDLSSCAKQPMTKSFLNNEYTIIYNGEIYNTDSLKQKLIQKGYNFETTGDTEIILNSFIEYREDCIKYLNGIFAFAIYDLKNESLYLFRDRLGVKPLFYSFLDNTLVFASEIKAIFNYPSIKPKIDINSLKEIFGIGPARTEGNGIFKNINEVKAGYYIKFDKNKFVNTKYWDLISKEHNDNYEQTVENVKYLVTNAIESQLISDVPVCTFLSGGIDSSIVTCISAKYLKNNFNKTLNTFSFDFKENDIHFKSNSFQPEQDRPYVDIILKEFSTNHSYLECDDINLIKLLYNSVDAKDLPGMADVDASMLYFCSIVSKHNKVALTGECADEIFGGYPWFYREELLNAETFPWSKNIENRTFILNKDLLKKLDLKEYSLSKYNKTIKETPYLNGESSEERRRREIFYLNIKWFMQTLLERMDRMSMYSGLEARVPFADYRIVEYLWNVPWKMKYKNNIEKSLLRDAFKDLLPKDILNRKKSPYPKIYNPTYQKLLSKKLTDIINDCNSPILNIIDKIEVLKFINTPLDYGKTWFGQLMAGPQLMAYLIQVNYWLKKYNLSF